MSSSEAPISRTYLFNTSAILCSGICRNGSEGIIFGVAAREAGCQRTYPRPHPRTRVSLRAHVRGQLVHSNSHLAMALQEDAGLPLRRRTLLLRITENKAATRQYRNIFPPRRRNGACVLRTQ